MNVAKYNYRVHTALGFRVVRLFGSLAISKAGRQKNCAGGDVKVIDFKDYEAWLLDEIKKSGKEFDYKLYYYGNSDYNMFDQLEYFKKIIGNWAVGHDKVIFFPEFFIVVDGKELLEIPIEEFPEWYVSEYRKYLARPIPEPVEHNPDLEF
jgi:hypothetical protein